MSLEGEGDLRGPTTNWKEELQSRKLTTLHAEIAPAGVHSELDALREKFGKGIKQSQFRLEGEYLNFASGEQWRVNRKGDLYMKNNKTGKFEEWDPEDNKLTGDYMGKQAMILCQDLSGNGQNTCTGNLFSCLQGNLEGEGSERDTWNKCVAFLQSTHENIWDAAKEQIKDVHPKVVQKLLQNLGFKTLDGYNASYGAKTKKIESVDKWARRMLPLLADKNRYFATNEELPALGLPPMSGGGATAASKLKFLQLLVAYVNSNPTLVDKELAKYLDEEAIEESAPYLSAVGLKANKPNQRLQQQNDSLKYYTKNSFAALSQNFLPPGLSFNPFVLDGGEPLYGGGDPISDVFGRVRTSSMMRSMIHGLEANLKSLNKELSKETKDNIEERLKQFELIEDELTRTIHVMREYADISRRTQSDERRENLTKEKMERLTQKRLSLLGKMNSQQGSIFGVIEALSKLTEEGRDESEYYVYN